VALINSKTKGKFLFLTLLAVVITSFLIIINETSAQPPIAPALKVGTSPIDIAVNPKTNMVYVVNQDSDTVSVINSSTNRVVADITIVTNMGEEQEDTIPTAVAVNPDMNMVYVADWWNDIISVINGSTNSVVAHIEVDFYPIDIAVNPKTNMVYVVN
jgi:YVTN family beta-propeller protein